MMPPLTLEELRRLARHHLEGLRLAGVEWLPLGPPVSITLAAPGPPATPSPSKASDRRPEAELFAESAPSDTDLTLEQRRVALDVLSKEVAGCLRCSGLISTRTQTV